MDLDLEIEKVIKHATDLGKITDNHLTAEYLANLFQVKRNTISHHLNVMVKNNQLVKVNTRPVIFFDKQRLESIYDVILQSSYDSLALLEADTKNKRDVFDTVIGNDGSLYAPIKQLKTAAQYPGVGLPVLLTGPTGAGKSFLAQKYFEFCVSQGYIDSEKKLITLNCAEYADNPELLASLLFGYKKGAFTGAEKNTEGLFAEADQGMIFLDEVHRLDPKGQEKLFGFLDNHQITPLGETKKSFPVSVRFVCATTENIDSSFLQTFIRRIPVQISIPSLNERSRSEREKLLLSFYFTEAKQVQKKIYLNWQVSDFLSSKNYSSNVGQLKNAVTISVANALARSRDDEKIKVRLADLPQSIFSVINKNDQQSISSYSKEILIDPDNIQEIKKMVGTKKQANLIFETVKRCIDSYKRASNSQLALKGCISEIDALCETLVYQYGTNRGRVPLDYFKETLNHELQYLEDDFGLKFRRNSVIIFAHYFYNKQFEHYELNSKQKCTLLEMTETFKPKDNNAVNFVEELLLIVGQKLDMPIDEIDKLVIYIYLAGINYETNQRPIRAIVLAHGYSTASSIADVVNKMFGKKIFDALDMEIDVGIDRIGEELTHYINRYSIDAGLLLLVDMGSLEGVSRFINQSVDFPIGIVNNVSTQMALEIANQIQQKENIEDIAHGMRHISRPKMNILYPRKAKTNLIITSCATGIGTANRIKKMLDDSLPSKKELIIRSYQFEQVSDPNFLDNLDIIYNTLAIVGTLDTCTGDIPYIPLEALISGKKIELLGRLLQNADPSIDIDLLNKKLLRNFSIERVLNSVTILDVHTVMENIDAFMKSYEFLSERKLSNTARMAVYVHVSCLIERLIRNDPIMDYQYSKETGKDIRNAVSFKNIKKSFSVIEDIYSVSIPDAEVGYIYDIITQNSAISTR